MAGRCPVCGLATDAAICPRCATILLRDRAICPTCGKMFPGRIAVCDACGRGLDADLDESEERAVRGFALVPGMDDGTARRLYARGFREFADVIKLGLPESAVKRGLHHTISRKILLRSVVPKAPHRIGRTTCVACHTNVLETETKCPACGAALGPDAEVAAIEKRLAEVQGSLVPLAEDPDFRSMPDPVRQEILREISTMLVAPSPPSDAEFRAQIEAWRRKGFDVDPILVLLAQHPNNFRERAVRLIRAQIRKKMEGGMFKCPLCDVYLEPAAEVCGNCGARFG
ncbi:MAG: hypothetical protein E6K16_06110 [Methanobacteriota archaeon]|nr:MAG: hypothetical protein E6K16_06110 [Euryarchaeota archaeon]